MMQPEPVWMVNYRLLIRDAIGSQLCLLPTANQLSLPTWQLPLGHFWQDVAHINAWVLQHLGLNTRVLRCIQIDDDFAQHHMNLSYELIAETTQPFKTGAWFAIDQAINDQRLAPTLALLLNIWQTQRLAATPESQAVPWYQPDWGPAAFQWVETVFAHAGIQPIGELEQYRTWNRSSVWRVATTHGDIYFKALPAMFGHEIGLTQHLVAYEPTHTANFLALEPQQRWMLLHDFAAPSLSQSSKIEQWQASLAAYAQLQIRQLAFRDQLEACGLAVRPLNWLSQQIEPLFNDPQAVLLDQPWGLTTSNCSRLSHSSRLLVALCKPIIFPIY